MGIWLFYRMKSQAKKASKKNIKSSQKGDLERLGKRIKQLRIDRGFSSYEYFAYEHNISRAQFGRYEKGEDLRYSSLLKVVRALDITLEDFFSEGFDN